MSDILLEVKDLHVSFFLTEGTVGRQWRELSRSSAARPWASWAKAAAAKV